MKPMVLFQANYYLRVREYLKKAISFKTTIRKKILGGFIIVIALVIMMSAFTYFKVDELNASSQEMMKESLYQVGLVEELAIDLANEAVAMRRFIFTNALSDVAAFEEARKYGDDKIIKLEKVLSSEKSRTFLETLKKEKGAYDAIATKTINAKRANNMDQVGVSLKQADEPYNNSMSAAKYLILAVKEQVNLEGEHNTQKASRVQMILVIVSLLVGGISVLISIYISRGISRPTTVIAEMQLAAVNETAHIVQQMSDGIQQIATNANSVALQSAQASQTALEGGKSVAKAVSQMAQIKHTVNSSAHVVTKLGKHSNEIGQIVGTISSIASQTNLLALNAAIEAGRAGENGRGFAVVADEVRKLAEQSQEAAKKIATLIGEIQGDTDMAVVAMKEGNNEVNLGTELVDAAGKAFQDIATIVIAVTDQVNEMSAAIQTMAGGSQQIVTSVEQIDVLSRKASLEAQTVSAATQEQSASMEEIASSSQMLAEMAYDLQEVVNQFRFR